MKKFIFISLFFLSFTTDQSNHIYFDPNYKEPYDISYRKLTWQDFKIVDDLPGDTTCLPSIGITYKYEYKNNKTIVHVNCFFDKSKSFVEKYYMTPSVLNHEQKHFDIAYIYSLKFIGYLKKEKYLDEKKINDIFIKVISEYYDYQLKYDLETNNSQLEKEQLHWNKLINNQLKN